MDKRTLGGKKKLVFEPKLPTAPLEIQAAPETKEKKSEERRKEVKTRERPSQHRMPDQPATLIGGTKEAPSFVFNPKSIEEITTEDLMKVENSPITVDKIAEKIKSREVESISIKSFANQKILLQIPKILAEEGQRYIKGKIIVKNEEMHLSLVGRLIEKDAPKEFLFRITPVETGMPQEAYKINEASDSLSRIGEVKNKFIASIVRNS
ncbi:hypothetical protein NEMIN01_0433 [Nematocida minor]|uniref:uncharacterized protein n=1 Tax=Nematocida minor TaxID=1912983 RepID=UPI002220956E|nr:uncharacterized protein NEMIN01_0433 [Nematocida minor]KAI5189370.1 hypothetical protein NEMIN01_0433 [Nematocida minor]